MPEEECPAIDVLLDTAAGRLPLSQALEHHVATCEPCRVAFADALRGDDAPSARPFGAAAPGDRISGRYRLVRVIGAGGAGTVWEAVDERRGGPVAVKILRRLEVTAARRQRREGTIAMTLVHPAIAPVLEMAAEDELRGPVLVMPLYEGEPLDVLLARERRLAPDAAASVLVPVLDALAFAHARGVVHRDVKPANVFVAHDGVRVLDFGLAKLLEEAADLGSLITRTGEVLGTPRFMAPEQVFGERALDARADVWSASAVAYLALTGESPIAATTLGETLRAHARDTIVPITTHRPDLPAPVATAIMHGLVRDREARAPSVVALRAALVATRR